MIWLALLLIASLALPSVASGDGQPPVTIIEIPVDTTIVTASSVVPPETTVLTTSPPPATSSPQIEDQTSSTVRWPLPWVAVVLLAVSGLLVLALVRPRRDRLPGDGVPSAISRTPPSSLVFALRHYKAVESRSESGTPSPIPVPGPTAAVPPLAFGNYEAVEYRSESGTSAVQPRALGEFESLEEAIDTARLARSWFVLNSRTEAFWVVWDRHLKRAAWIAESGTPEESVIDLRTGRRQPYIARSKT